MGLSKKPNYVFARSPGSSLSILEIMSIGTTTQSPGIVLKMVRLLRFAYKDRAA